MVSTNGKVDSWSSREVEVHPYFALNAYHKARFNVL